MRKIIDLFLPIIIYLGIATSYEDFTESKIRNRHLIIAILAGIIIYISQIVITFINPEKAINWWFYIEILTSTFIMLTVGFFLWQQEFWSAGDAKLIFAYSFLIPVSVYGSSRIPLLSHFYILFNSFIPFFLISIIFTLRDKLSSHKWTEITNEFKLKSIFENIGYAFTFSWITRFLNNLINIENNIISIAISSGLLMYITRKFIQPFTNIFKKKYKKKSKSILSHIPAEFITYFAMGIIAIARIILEYDYIFTLSFLKEIIIVYAFISVIKSYIRSEVKRLFISEVDIVNLQEGMHLADEIIKKGKRYLVRKKDDFEHKNTNQENISNKNKLKNLKEISEKDIKEEIAFSEELATEDIKKLRELYKSKKLDFSKVRTHKTMPFAPLIFLGVILTIIAGGAITDIFL